MEQDKVHQETLLTLSDSLRQSGGLKNFVLSFFPFQEQKKRMYFAIDLVLSLVASRYQKTCHVESSRLVVLARSAAFSLQRLALKRIVVACEATEVTIWPAEENTK